MATKSFRDAVDRILDGGLEQVIRDGRAVGLSDEQIARRLADHDIDVTGETVRRWANHFGLPKRNREAVA